MNYLTVGILLADEPNRGPDYGKASPVGLLVVLLLLVGVFLLWRSMGRQLKKVPASFDAPDTPDTPDNPASPGTLDAGAGGPIDGPEATVASQLRTDGGPGPDTEAAPRGTGG